MLSQETLSTALDWSESKFAHIFASASLTFGKMYVLVKVFIGSKLYH